MTQVNIMEETNKYFGTIETFVVAGDLFQETLNALRAEGNFRVESLVFWGGGLRDSTAIVTHVFVPKGDGVFKHPLQVRITEDIIAALGDLLDPPHLVVLGQVHTHLEDAFHSPVDDSFSFDTPGYLSLVVPRGGADDWRSWRHWCFFECTGPGAFRQLSLEEIDRRFVVDQKRTTVVQDVFA